MIMVHCFRLLPINGMLCVPYNPNQQNVIVAFIAAHIHNCYNNTMTIKFFMGGGMWA